MKEVEKQLKEQKLIDSNYRHSIQLERDVLVNSLHKLVEDQKKGAQIRSRAKWIEEGEKCTKFFHGLEQKNIANHTIRQLKKDDGNFTTYDTEILEEEYKYYQSLYAKENITANSIKSYLQNIDNINTLSKVEANALEGELTDTECLAAINGMKTNKSPGSDGIPMEFYKVFWEEIRDIFLQSINEAYHLGELSPTQKRGLLNLLYKKNVKAILSNWRPISLLNTDYKIMAHALANRLKKVIDKLIHTDQSGYIKGRNIHHNIRLIQDVIDYFEENEEEGAIIFLDFQKAFDTINYQFLFNGLLKFNFGNSFIRWIETMYKNAETCVTNNGWTSTPLPIHSGIRRGCPLSALLFLVSVEILAANIRKENNDGLEIRINNHVENIQISQLADGTTLFLKDEMSILNCLQKDEAFGKVSGLRKN